MSDKKQEEFISLLLVTNDRAEDLKECLSTVRQYVKRVVLVDTGCGDDVIELARTYDCDVHKFDFDGDLSAARNFGLSKVEDEWVLVMDGDEVFDPNAIVKFHWLITNRPHSAYMVEVHDLKAVARVPQIRLFRNDKNLRYRGKYGEVPDIAEGFEPDQEYFANSSAVIYNQRRHDSDAELSAYKDRIARYKKTLVREPNDLFMMYRLGLDNEFIGYHKDAIAYYRDVAEKDAAGIFPLAIRNLAICLQYQGKTDMAINVLSRGLKRFPDYTDLGFELGMILMKAGDLETASGVFRQCKERQDAPIHYPSIPGTGGVLADFGAGLVSEMQGRTDGSQLSFINALDQIKENSLQLLYLGTVLRRMYEDEIAKKTFKMLADLENQGVQRIYKYLFNEEAPAVVLSAGEPVADLISSEEPGT